MAIEITSARYGESKSVFSGVIDDQLVLVKITEFAEKIIGKLPGPIFNFTVVKDIEDRTYCCGLVKRGVWVYKGSYEAQSDVMVTGKATSHRADILESQIPSDIRKIIDSKNDRPLYISARKT